MDGWCDTNGSMTDPVPIRPVSVDEFSAYLTVGEHAFNSTAPRQAIEDHERRVFEPDRSLAALDGDTIVGTAAAYSYQLSVPGGMLGCAGVTMVAVLPSHRRRGILSAIMVRQLADIAAGTEPIAALFSSESSIYGRFGYGCASADLSFTLKHGEGKLRSAATGDGRPRLSICDPAEVRGDLAKLYEAALVRPGMPARDERWWDAQLNDVEAFRHGMGPQRCLLAADDSGPRGYALYAAKSSWGDDGIPVGELSVNELIAADPQAAAALWADLLNRDLVGVVHARQRPVDDPLLSMLVDRRRARSYLTDGLWIRLINLPVALAGRQYASPLDLVLEVTDDLLPANSGRWRLAASQFGWPVSCERTTAAADIRLQVQVLGAAYLGGTRLSELAGAGQLSELTPGAVARLSAAMWWDPAPWCPAIF
jgi:predicted acetyltransferase